MTDKLADGIAAAIEREAAGVTPPVMDLAAVRRRGNRRRLARAGATAAVILAVLGGGYGVVSQLGGQQQGKTKEAAPPFPLASLDFSAGARAYYDPDNSEMYLGGKRFPMTLVDGLDTDATVSSGGVVYFMPDQQPRLLRADGTVVDLASAPASPDSNFHPSATAEPGGNQVVWLTKGGDGVRLGTSDVTTAQTVTHDLSDWCSAHDDCATLTWLRSTRDTSSCGTMTEATSYPSQLENRSPRSPTAGSPTYATRSCSWTGRCRRRCPPRWTVAGGLPRHRVSSRC